MQVLNTQLGVFCFANFVIACCSVTAVAATGMFLGKLTAMEASRLTQRLLKYLLIKVALVGMVVLPQQVALLHWLPWLAAIGELKMFVGLSKDRLSSLSVTPAAGLSHHARTLCLLMVILAAHALCMAVLWVAQLRQLNWAVCVLFGLDLAVTAVDAAKATVSCVALLMDEALAATAAVEPPSTLCGRALASWERWQGQGRNAVLYHLELGADVAMHTLTLVHHVHVWVLHGLSFNLLDALLLFDTRAVVLAILQRLRLHKRHIAATNNIDSAFPDAPEALLAAEAAECVICRDRLTTAKQLPCGHMFHLPCLRAWFQQSGGSNLTCPMCRTSLLLPCSPAAVTGTTQSGTSTAGHAGQQQWRLQQQQHPGLQLDHQPGSAPAGSDYMRRLSFSLSLDELPGLASSGQYRQYVQQLQLYDRADSWGSDVLQQGMLDSPASDMALQDDLARALAASLLETGHPVTSPPVQILSQSSQDGTEGDSGARESTSTSSSSTSSGGGSRSFALLSGGAQLMYNCGSASRSSSSSPASHSSSTAQICQAAVHSAVPVPPAIVRAAEAAAEAGASGAVDLSSSPFATGPVQQQYSLDSGGGAANSSGRYRGSGSSAWLGDDSLSDAAERFYSQQYGDPLEDSDPAATGLRSPSLAAASHMCRTCSRVLASLISKTPSFRSDKPEQGVAQAAPATDSAPPTPAEAATLLDSRAGSSCADHNSKHRHHCHRCRRPKHCGQRQREQQRTDECGTGAREPDEAEGIDSASNSRCREHHKHCQNSSCSHCPAGVEHSQRQTDLAATAAAAGGPQKRVLPGRYAALRLDTSSAHDQGNTTASEAPRAAAAAATAPIVASAAAAAEADAVSDISKAPRVGHDHPSGESSAAAAVCQLITSPRDPHKRREEGRWGRRRLLVTQPSAAAHNELTRLSTGQGMGEQRLW